MKLDIIFVTYNNDNIIKDCYDRVKKELKDIKHKIIFVDNFHTKKNFYKYKVSFV